MPISLLSLLDEEQKQSLYALSTEITYPAGHQLFNKGDNAETMYLVERGKVSLYRLMPNGDEKLFKVFLPGELIAEMAMFMEPRQYPMSARVDQDSVLLAFKCQDILDMVSNSPELSLKLLGHMSNRIAQLMNTVNILTQVNANQRLVMKLADLYRAQAGKEGKVTLPVTKKLFATQLGMTPETLSRALKKLKQDGYIEESGNHITLLDVPGLCQAVELTPDIFG